MKKQWQEKIKRLKKEIAKLKELAELGIYTDPLTKVWNCAYFQNSLNKILKAPNKSLPASPAGRQVKFSVAIIDIDDFKEYNDTKGHQAGDVVIKKAADILKKNSSTCDIVARCGGEEFSVIFPNKNSKRAYKILEKSRKEFEKFAKPKIKGLPKKLTISAGISSYPKNGSTKMQLLKKADLALYNAKKKGKNKVSIYH